MTPSPESILSVRFQMLLCTALAISSDMQRIQALGFAGKMATNEDQQALVKGRAIFDATARDYVTALDNLKGATDGTQHRPG